MMLTEEARGRCKESSQADIVPYEANRGRCGNASGTILPVTSETDFKIMILR